MLFEKIGIINEDFDYISDMYVGVSDDRITYISDKAPDDAARGSFGASYDGRGKLLMPGFFNTHGHSPMCLMRGYGENLPLDRWLNEKIFPFEDKLYDEAVYYATLLTAAESLSNGIVSTTDMYAFSDAIIRAVGESGIKENLCRQSVCFGGDPKENITYIENEALLAGSESFGGRLIRDAGIHAEYTNTDEMIRAVVELAHKYDANIHIHVAETEFETEGCKERHGGLSPVAHLNKMGVFERRTTAAHCVWLSDEDMDILKEKNVYVASNPASNFKLASGICDVPKLYSKGVNVTLGTDSVASNNDLNYFEQIKLFALAGKIKSMDPAVMEPKEVLYSATRGGAVSQGRDDTGLLKEGFKADLIAVDITGPNMNPVHDMLNNLVYSATGENVKMTMVDGKVLYNEGEFTTIDLEKAEAGTEKARVKILETL